MLSEAWYRDEMPRFKSFFEDGTIEVARDADHLDDYRAIKMIKGVAKLPDTKTKGKDGRQRHGDVAIAAAMAVSATRMDSFETEIQSTGRVRPSTGHLDFTGSDSRRDTEGF